MKEKIISDPFFFLCQFQGIGNQHDRVGPTQMVRHDKAIKQVFDHRKKRPAALSSNVCDIRHPLLVGTAGREISGKEIGVLMHIREIFEFVQRLWSPGYRSDTQPVHPPQHGFVVDHCICVLLDP